MLLCMFTIRATQTHFRTSAIYGYVYRYCLPEVPIKVIPHSNNTVLITFQHSLSQPSLILILHFRSVELISYLTPYLFTLQRHEVQPDVYCRRLGLQVPVAVSVKTNQTADVFHAICNIAMNPCVFSSLLVSVC